MVTLKFVFNQEKLEKIGKTEEEMLTSMREYAKLHHIDEIEHGLFAKDGEHAMCILFNYVPDTAEKDAHFLDLLDELTLDVDGEKEDCIEPTKEYLEELKKEQLNF